MKKKACQRSGMKPFFRIRSLVLLLFFLLFSGYIISLTSHGKEGTRQPGESYQVADTERVVEDADRTLAIFNRTIAIVALVGGSAWACYHVRTGRSQRKTRGRVTGQGSS